MTRRSFFGSLILIVLAVITIACGGSGGDNLSATARRIQSLQQRSLVSFAMSGISGPGFMTNGGTTGSGTSGGGGFGVPSMGGFLRNFNGGSARPMGGSTGGTNGGTTGSGGFDGFYFDPFLKLWVDCTFTETAYTCLFYEDEAKQHPAGHVTSNFTGEWSTYPQSYSSSYEYTAGFFAGAHGTYECSQPTSSEGTMSYEDVFSDGSLDSGESSWGDKGSQFQAAWTATDGSWFHDNGAWSNDGSGTYHCETSDGWTGTWTFNADGSGSAELAGPDPRLPATLVWTSAGHFTITYVDGSTEEWNWNQVEAGTSGSTGGNSGSSTTG